nr:alpha/beta hydrolase [Dyella mobilis]
MHLFCTGEGSPTVLLESGFGDDFTAWAKVQPVLSKITRTCSYDRAGFGWSESQPGVADAEHVADTLHTLLDQAGITEPVVLMGHSLGGVYIRDYAMHFPHDVAGMVLVDATTPMPPSMPASLAALDKHGAAEFLFLRALIDLGIARATGQCDAIPPGFDAYAGWIRANTCVPNQMSAYRQAYDAVPASLAEVARSGRIGDFPILIFSQDPEQTVPAMLAQQVSPADWQTGMRLHDDGQEALKKLSPYSRRIIAKGSSHYIQYDRPDLLDREVTAFIQHIRRGEALPDNGITSIE